MTAASVTVLIPTFNRAAWLIEALESILAQTRQPDEIIVINDGSTDDTIARLEPYQDRIQVLNQDNSGKSTALNRAMSLANGTLIWIFDDDDIAEPDALETLLGLLSDNPDADFAYGPHDRFEVCPDGHVIWQDTGYWRNCPPEDFLFETMLDMFAHQPGMLVRKSLYNRAGPFNKDLVRSQDYDMLLRLAQHGRPASTQNILFHQRQHSQPRGTASRVVTHEERFAVWRRYDQRILRNIRETLPLGKYLPADYNLTQSGMMRRALIRRGAVMARKGLWEEAGEDLRRAAHLSDLPLLPDEAADLRQMFMLKDGNDSGLTDPGVRKMLFSLRQESLIGTQIARVLGRAMLWRIRLALKKGNIVRALKLVSLVIGLNLPYKHFSHEAESSYVRRQP